MCSFVSDFIALEIMECELVAFHDDNLCKFCVACISDACAVENRRRVVTERGEIKRKPKPILVPRAYDPSGLRQESRALGATHFEITQEITEFCPSGFTQSSSTAHARNGCSQSILVPRAHDPSGLWQESRALALSNTGSPRFTDFPSNLANLIG